MSKPLYSFHSFMFPFRWDYLSRNKKREDIPYSERTELADFDRIFSGNGLLNRVPYRIDRNNEKYNEYTYFHSFVRRAMFFTQADDLSRSEIVYYERDGGTGDYFRIGILNQEPLELDLDSICLHIYSTGVGILTYNVNNSRYPEKATILKINEYGRRIYPQFLAGRDVSVTKSAFLADYIEVKAGHRYMREDFSGYNHPVRTEETFLPPDHIRSIFGVGEDFVFHREEEKKGRVKISKLTDDRMFFVSWYGNDTSQKIISSSEEARGGLHPVGPEKLYSDWWYCYLFGDKSGPSVKNTNWMNRDFEAATNARWAGSGTLYGTTRDSFVAISHSRENLVPDISVHTRTMYYQMAVLCLAQRASILRFSYEIGTISNELDKGSPSSPKIRDLYKNYIHFINKIYFREVTSQIQGIEIYSQMQQAMNLQKEMGDLDKEVSELHNYANMVEQGRLSRVANWFLPAGVIVGFLGMNVFDEKDLNLSGTFNWEVLTWGLLVISISVFAVLITKIIKK